MLCYLFLFHKASTYYLVKHRGFQLAIVDRSLEDYQALWPLSLDNIKHLVCKTFEAYFFFFFVIEYVLSWAHVSPTSLAYGDDVCWCMKHQTSMLSTSFSELSPKEWTSQP